MTSDEKDERVQSAHRGPETDPLGTQLGMMIGRALKAHYDEIVEAPVPDKFLDLLAQLETSEQTKGEGDQ